MGFDGSLSLPGMMQVMVELATNIHNALIVLSTCSICFGSNLRMIVHASGCLSVVLSYFQLRPLLKKNNEVVIDINN